ncbi:hypothetical protein EIN_114800 [Entamoeba invadens IP1]|uniref:Uncharacterized protein n=1 Tax=Entamoeba invadens IP1 TaxID=370355 RepID=A0A0A1U197_ENTIV|nr:hypothetical protein EIN_114800 [Entamoeba invadens IP1]ELP86286.1 hypothetical protein EIN_114800 [Entamoeba invadens IP1]|eukprot:XP_004185632.1 hypothetical protein EIN_114800 [Entamoeba invadens IP1]
MDSLNEISYTQTSEQEPKDKDGKKKEEITEDKLTPEMRNKIVQYVEAINKENENCEQNSDNGKAIPGYVAAIVVDKIEKQEEKDVKEERPVTPVNEVTPKELKEEETREAQQVNQTQIEEQHVDKTQQPVVKESIETCQPSQIQSDKKETIQQTTTTNNTTVEKTQPLIKSTPTNPIPLENKGNEKHYKDKTSLYTPKESETKAGQVLKNGLPTLEKPQDENTDRQTQKAKGDKISLKTIYFAFFVSFFVTYNVMRVITQISSLGNKN